MTTITFSIEQFNQLLVTIVRLRGKCLTEQVEKIQRMIHSDSVNVEDIMKLCETKTKKTRKSKVEKTNSTPSLTTLLQLRLPIDHPSRSRADWGDEVWTWLVEPGIWYHPKHSKYEDLERVMAERRKHCYSN